MPFGSTGLAEEVFEDPTAELPARASGELRSDVASDAAFARLEASERRRAVRDLRRATAEGGFALSLTPCRVLAAGGGQDGVRGAEAALRWPRRLGMSSLGGLLPLIASSGLSSEVGAWLMQAACEAAMLWPEGTGAGIVSIDATSSCLADSSLLGHVTDALAATQLPPGRLEIEIAEQTLNDGRADILFALSALCDLGVSLALDHFGADSASLLTLKHLPLTMVKLDRSLTRDLPHNHAAEAVVAAAIQCAHRLDAAVVAIGVETEAQRELLIHLGCDFAQGTFYGPALSPDGFIAALAAERAG